MLVLTIYSAYAIRGFGGDILFWSSWAWCSGRFQRVDTRNSTKSDGRRCIPIATIFPPATLSVVNAPETIASMLEVPQHDFTTLNFVSPMASTDGVDGMSHDLTTELSLWAWSGPSQPLQNIAVAAMALGQILPITALAPNASWTLNFWGPLLRCNDVVAIERAQFGVTAQVGDRIPVGAEAATGQEPAHVAVPEPAMLR